LRLSYFVCFETSARSRTKGKYPQGSQAVMVTAAARELKDPT